MNEKKEEVHLERPLECTECRRPIKVCYTEIVGKAVTKVGHCEECPVLRRKMQGQAILSSKETEGSATSLCCGSCGLVLDDVKMGASLGCPLCYDIFSEQIIHELYQLERLPVRHGVPKKGDLLHVGRVPGEQKEIDPSLKLLVLHQALSETLGREDYEQAALLRDQIRALEEGSKEEKEDESGKNP